MKIILLKHDKTKHTEAKIILKLLIYNGDEINKAFPLTQIRAKSNKYLNDDQLNDIIATLNVLNKLNLSYLLIYII